MKSPTYQEQVFRKNPLKPGETRTDEIFLAELGTISKMTTECIAREEVELHDGSRRKLLRCRASLAAIPGADVIAWVDDEGNALKSTTSLLGTEMAMYAVSEAIALKTIEGESLDIAMSSVIKVGLLPGIDQCRSAKYIVTSASDAFRNRIPQTPFQKPTRDGTNLEVLVTAAKFPEKPTDVNSPGDQYLKPSQFLQSDDEKVIALAREACAEGTAPKEVIEKCRDYVYRKISKKTFSTALASAGEVARSLEGDCTEHAVLLAAILRVRKIPSRVAVGVVYVSQLEGYGGHMWTEAWLDGIWFPIDAAFNRNLNSGYLTFSETSLADDGPNPLGELAAMAIDIGQMSFKVELGN